MRDKAARTQLFNHRSIAEKWNELILKDFHSVTPVSREIDFLVGAQKNATFKKYPPQTKKDGHYRADVAIQKFLDVQRHLASLSFDDLVSEPFAPKAAVKQPKVRWTLERARAVCRCILGDFCHDEWYNYCKHGPGISLGMTYEDTGLSRKWLHPWTTTERAVPYLCDYLSWDSSLCAALRHEYPDLKHPSKVWAHVEIVEGSRLTTVPKNDETDRTIAIEPTVNMYLQQGLGGLIASRLAAFGVDIQSQQQVHREMAHIASLTRSMATIDFSSASDCVSTDLLRFLLPPAWFAVVDAVRCDTVTVRNQRIHLSCIATMGNASTFALETLVFYSIGVALFGKGRSLLPQWSEIKNLSVFGDDCIIPTEHADHFIEVCKAVGFIVNASKTFTDPIQAFRESCGADYLGGYNVRPLYLRGPRSNKRKTFVAWLYTVWNVTLKMLIRSIGPLPTAYAESLAFLASELSRRAPEILLVPDGDPDDAGLKTFGDTERLKRLFSAPFAASYLDQNGTVRYKRLVSAKSGEGLFVEAIAYAERLKNPPNLDYLFPSRPSGPPFEKADRGYVVSWGYTFNVSLPARLEPSRVLA